MSARPKPELPELCCVDQDEWERWLEMHHGDRSGVWLMFAKKDSPERSVSYSDALDCALCFGWIDGQRRRRDEDFHLIRFTPRGPRSVWSQINRKRAEELIAAGRMRPPGQAAVGAAVADGRWDRAYEPQSRATVPEDLRRALAAEPAAAAFFATLTGARRYAFLYRLHNVRSPASRAQRIASYIELLREGRTLN